MGNTTKGPGRPTLRDGEQLVPRSTKVYARDWEYLKALAQVQKMDGVREILEDMIRVYEKKKPDVAAKARQIVALQEG